MCMAPGPHPTLRASTIMSKPLSVRVHHSNGDAVGFEVPNNATQPLLRAMEQAGIETHYHCRAGFCGACRTRLIAGKVAYTTEPLAYVRGGDVLPCVCIAMTDLELEH